MIKPKIISKTASYGNQRWKINSDGSYYALAFGTTAFNQYMHWFWIDVPKKNVPEKIKEILK